MSYAIFRPATHFAAPGKRVEHAHEFTQGTVEKVVAGGQVLVAWDHGPATVIPTFDLEPCA